MANNKSKKRKSLTKNFGPFCTYCTKVYPLHDLTIDHVVPKKMGGSNGLVNLTLSCRDCNHKKGEMLLTQFLRAYEVKITKEIMRLL